METIIWGALFAVFVIIEICTMGLATIWFAVGALFAVILAALGLPIWVQVVVFLAVSIVLLYFTRPIAMKHFNNDRTKTNVESLIGEIAIVTESVDNLQNKGTILLRGQEWSARSNSQEGTIAKDAKVRVVGIEGVKAIVEITE